VFLPDTSCMVAGVSAWHIHYARARGELEKRFERGEEMVVAAPALVESYSVLTRLPAPRRLSPDMCRELLTANFGSDAAQLVALEPFEYERLIRDAPESGVAGGRIYDAVILACAQSAGVDSLLTFNERQFSAFASSGVRVVVP
jgi:predicted nucleic acid-binding protein